MTTFKDRLEADLRAAIKSRDELTTSTLRMAIAAVRNEEVAGKQARTLSDDEVGVGADQFAYPRLLSFLIRHHVQVGDVQHA